MGKNFIRYTDYSGKTCTQPLVWWRHDGINQGFYAHQIPADGSVKCLACNANNWTDNGETMNQYECGSCGAFITTEPKNETC